MSVYYQVFEHLTINKKPEENPKDDQIKFLAQSHFSLLAMKNILYQATINKLYIKYDDKEVTLTDSNITSKLQDALRELTLASQIEIIADYGLIWGHYSSHIDLDIFTLSHFLARCPDDFFDSARYVFYHFSDDNLEDVGDLALYGYKGETLLRGKIEAERVTEIPKDIPWQAYQTALHLEGVTIEAKYQKAVKTSCKKLMSLTSEDPYNLYEEDEDGIYCFMCMPILASRDDFKKFIHHSSVLKRHIEEDEFFNSAPYFYNQSNDEPKILYLDVKKDGSCHYYISRA